MSHDDTEEMLRRNPDLLGAAERPEEQMREDEMPDNKTGEGA